MSLILLLCLGMFVLTSNVFAFDATLCINKGVTYLQSVQNEDGGFPGERGRESNTMVTGWVVMALRAVGEDPAGDNWSKNGLTPATYLLRQTAQLEATTDYARTLLALTAANYGTVYQGSDLAEKILSWQLPEGQFAQTELGEEALISPQIWSVLALKSAQKEIRQQDKVLGWLISQQNSDGGFSWAIGGESDPDDTGVALSALAALGLNKDDVVVKKALQYLKEQQNKDGGFCWTEQKTNTATDAWVIQGLLAVGEDPQGANWQIEGISPLDHLCSLQNSDGSFQWVSGLNSSPVLMTAYALLALSGKSLPVNLSDSGQLKDDLQDDKSVQQNNNSEDNNSVANENQVKFSGDLIRFLKKVLLNIPQFLWL